VRIWGGSRACVRTYLVCFADKWRCRACWSSEAGADAKRHSEATTNENVPLVIFRVTHSAPVRKPQKRIPHPYQVRVSFWKSFVRIHLTKAFYWSTL